jgi:hypothetical protein
MCHGAWTRGERPLMLPLLAAEIADVEKQPLSNLLQLGLVSASARSLHKLERALACQESK